jgi:hypothetical protein
MKTMKKYVFARYLFFRKLISEVIGFLLGFIAYFQLLPISQFRYSPLNAST